MSVNPEGVANKRIEQNARRSAARRQAGRVCSCAVRRQANAHHSPVAPDAQAGQTDDMRSNDLDISRLSVAERIQLAEDLWDSVAAETGDFALTAAQSAELDRRLAALTRDPEAGESWPVVGARIEQRLDKAG